MMAIPKSFAGQAVWRRTALGLVLVLSAASVLPSAAETPDFSGWSWQCPIESDSRAGEFAALPLTPQILDHAQLSLADLRILDESRTLVPFVIDRRESKRETVRHAASLLNATFKLNAYERVVLDFGDTLLKERLQVSLSGQNFRRRAQVEASADGLVWSDLVEEAWFFDISQPFGSYKVDVLDLPRNDFRFLRLTVYAMADETERFAIISAAALVSGVADPVDWLPVEVIGIETRQDEDRPVTIMELDCGLKNQPLRVLQLDCGEAYFHRAYRLYGRNAIEEDQSYATETGTAVKKREVPWQQVSSGVIYRIQTNQTRREGTIIRYLDAPFRFLKLEIFNQDDRPLDFAPPTVFSDPMPRLVFKREPGSKRTLIFGNPDARAPVFDLARAVTDLRSQNLELASLGAIHPYLPDKPKAPWTEGHQALIWGVLILAVVLVLFLILGGLPRKTFGDEG